MATKTNSDPPAGLRLHTVEEAAAILRCSSDFLYELVRERVVPVTKIGRRLLFTDAHLQAVVAHFERKPVKR